MASEMKKGIWLCQTGDAREDSFGWLLHTFAGLAVYGALAVTFLEVTGYREITEPMVMLLAGGCLIAVHGFLMKLHQQKWFYPGALALLLAAVLLGRTQLLEGVCLLWNRLGYMWTKGTGWVLPELETRLGTEAHGACLVLLSVTLGWALALICCGVTAKAGWITSVLLTGALAVGLLCFRSELSAGCVLLILSAAILMLLYSGWKNRKPVLPILLSCGFCAVLTGTLFAIAMLPAAKDWSEQVSHRMHTQLHERKFETAYVTLPEGDFTDYQKETDDVKPALVVTMEKPEAMYLRGFVGCTFEDNVWNALDNEALAENKELLYWLNLEEFYPAAQFEAAAAGQEMQRNLITVQNLGTCSKYLYVPFSLQAGEYLQPENLQTDAVFADGGRTYLYSALYGGEEVIAQVLEQLQASGEEAVLRYRRAESAYRSFVNSHYLQVSEEMEERLSEQMDKLNLNVDSRAGLTPQQAQEYALTFLSLCFPEEGTPENIELPLKVAADTSYQYATVAVLTLRYFGIPARYAEGYVITEQMAAQAGNNASLTVDSTCAQAWVEVYQDGIGWIPMDLTPGLGELTNVPVGVGPNPSECSDPNIQEGQEQEENPETNEPEPEPDGGTLVLLQKMIWWSLLLVILAVLALLLLVILRRHVLLRKKEQRFRSENRSDAVAWIFSDTALLLEQMGFDRGNGSMLALCDAAGEQFGEEYEQELRDMITLNARAMFSTHALDESEWEAALAFRSKTLLHLQATEKWNRRLWMQWIRCLY